MAQELTPPDFNKACLMTYGEIAERFAKWAADNLEDSPRTRADGDLGPVFFAPYEEGSQAFAQRLAAGLLKLSTEDVR